VVHFEGHPYRAGSPQTGVADTRSRHRKTDRGLVKPYKHRTQGGFWEMGVLCFPHMQTVCSYTPPFNKTQ